MKVRSFYHSACSSRNDKFMFKEVNKEGNIIHNKIKSRFKDKFKKYI